MIVSFLNQKGGVGKTTLAINIAYWFKQQGSSVLLVDSDPQGSARNWHNESGGTKLDVIGLDRPTLDIDIKNLNFDHDWIFIDGVPQTSIMAAKAVKCSDIVLVPVQPSPYDIWASEDIVKLIKSSQEFSKKPKAAFVINRKIGNSNLGKEVKEAISGYGLPIFESHASQRVVYAQTAVNGNTVLDAGENEAANEIKNIGLELMGFSNDK